MSKKNHAPFWRRTIRGLLGRRGDWPAILVEVSDASDDAVVLQRPRELPKPGRDCVWVKDGEHGTAYQLHVLQMARALSLHT